MAADIIALLDDLDEIEEEFDDEDEEGWWLAAATVGANHGINHCCAEPCRTAPYTGSALVKELLESHQWRRCQEVLRMPWHTFKSLVEFFKEHTALADGKHVNLEEKTMIFLSMVGQPMGNRGAQERYQHSGDTISKYVKDASILKLY
jgi:hypothetical protein